MSTNNTVLIIEDDRDVRSALLEVLSFYGVDVKEASNGHEGLQLLETIPVPRLIILDAMMPVMDGPTFYKKFRAIEKFNGVPVILFSAVAEKFSLEGLAGHLKKPADMEELIGYVSKYCEVAQA